MACFTILGIEPTIYLGTDAEGLQAYSVATSEVKTVWNSSSGVGSCV